MVYYFIPIISKLWFLDISSLDSHSQGSDSTKAVSLELDTPQSSRSKSSSSHISDNSSRTNLSRPSSIRHTPVDTKLSLQEIYSVPTSSITLSSSRENELDKQGNCQDSLALTLKFFQESTSKWNTPLPPSTQVPPSQEVYSVVSPTIRSSSREDKVNMPNIYPEIFDQTLLSFVDNTTKAKTNVRLNTQVYQDGSVFNPDKCGLVVSNVNEMHDMNSNSKASEITRF